MSTGAPYSTIFSEDRAYRYTLYREWEKPSAILFPETFDKLANFVALNPSTADETKDDPTIRREIAFAKAWGFCGLLKTNIFAFRATDPVVMKRVGKPIGTDNDFWIEEAAKVSGIVIAAWGTHGEYLDRGRQVAKKIRSIAPGKLHHLGLSKHGFPKASALSAGKYQADLLAVIYR